MFYLCNVLPFIIDSFNQCSFSEQNLVGNTHHFILFLTLVTSCISLMKRFSNRAWPIYPLSAHSFDILQKLTLLQRFPVIHVSWREHKIENLTLVIDYQMQLESKEPPHWTVSKFGKSLKCLMNKDSLVTTDTWRSGVSKTDVGEAPRQDFSMKMVMGSNTFYSSTKRL